MAQASFEVGIPDRLWIGTLSAAHPETTIRLLASVTGTNSDVGLLQLSGPNVERVVEEVGRTPQVTDLATVDNDGNTTTLCLESRGRNPVYEWHEAAGEITGPVEISAGKAVIDVTGSHERLAEVARTLTAADLPFRIVGMRERLADRTLTSRQRDVVVCAVEQGYYDTPRSCSLTELADQLGIAKSTCSETIHRAEEVIVKQYVDELVNDEERREDETRSWAE